jgi:hypothetical protein
MYVVENEAEVFKSESLMIKAAEELNYNHAFTEPTALTVGKRFMTGKYH